MAASAREWVRRAVGLAALAPAAALLVLAVSLALDGGASGVLAGLVVAGIALVLVAFAFVMTYAPVSIHKLLRRTDERRSDSGSAGANDQAASRPPENASNGSGLEP